MDKDDLSLLHTLPSCLSLRHTSLSVEDFGIWSKEDIPIGTRFGPYEGTITSNVEEAQESGYSWKIKKEGNTTWFVEAKDQRLSNWLRYVNSSCDDQKQNLAILQCQGEIYYIACKDIAANTELLVWYARNIKKDRTSQKRGQCCSVHVRGKNLHESAFKLHQNLKISQFMQIPYKQVLSGRSSESQRKQHEKIGLSKYELGYQYTTLKSQVQVKKPITHIGQNSNEYQKRTCCNRSVKRCEKESSSTGNKYYKCILCLKHFLHFSHLQVHMMKYHEVKVCKCNFKKFLKSSYSDMQKNFRSSSCGCEIHKMKSMQNHNSYTQRIQDSSEKNTIKLHQHHNQEKSLQYKQLNCNKSLQDIKLQNAKALHLSNRIGESRSSQKASAPRNTLTGNEIIENTLIKNNKCKNIYCKIHHNSDASSFRQIVSVQDNSNKTTGRRHLQIFEKVNTKEPFYKCLLCNVQFKYNYDLERHKQMHIGQKQIEHTPHKGVGCNNIMAQMREKYHRQVGNRPLSHSSNFKAHVKVAMHQQPLRRMNNINYLSPVAQQHQNKGSENNSMGQRMREFYKSNTDQTRHSSKGNYIVNQTGHSSNSKLYRKTDNTENSSLNKEPVIINLRDDEQDHILTKPLIEPKILYRQVMDILEDVEKVTSEEAIFHHMTTSENTSLEGHKISLESNYECSVCHEMFTESAQLELHQQTHSSTEEELPGNEYEATEVHSETDKECTPPEVIEICDETVEEQVEKDNVSSDAAGFPENEAMKECSDKDQESHIESALCENAECSDKTETAGECSDKDERQEVENTSAEITGCSKQHEEEGTSDKNDEKKKLMFECGICHKQFSQYSYLCKHKWTHAKAKRHECNICHKKFSQRCYLRDHIKIHTGERPYKCSTCPRTFIQRCNWQRHERLHRGEKRFSCDVCHRKFFLKVDLVAHRWIHFGEKPYGCDLCSKRFIRLGHLATHRKTHTGERPHECEFCHQRFLFKRAMLNHRARHFRDIWISNDSPEVICIND